MYNTLGPRAYLTTMKYQESIRTLLSEHLNEIKASTHPYGPEIPNCILYNGNYTQRVYDVFFNWITDSTQTPESIIYLLDTYINELDGFSTNKSLQTLVSFPCLEALASRRPEVLEGQWEKVAWIIIKYSTFSNTLLWKKLANFKQVNVATLKWIVEVCSPELCPNLCLRLELFRLMRAFSCDDFDYDHVRFRDIVINTLFEVCENYTSFTVDQLPNFSPMDLQFVIKDNDISIVSILTVSDLFLNRSDIIAAVLKLTRNLILLEKEKHQRLNNQAIEVQVSNIGLENQLYACLSFCGLIPIILEYDIELDQCDFQRYFVKAIGNDPFLLNNIVHTLDTIIHVSLCFPDEHLLHYTVTRRKDKLLNTFFKSHISQLPKHQYLQEIHGGFAPAAEYRLRYFQNNNAYKDDFEHEDDSEYYAYNENDNWNYDSEEMEY